jgi:hypothetical protein
MNQKKIMKIMWRDRFEALRKDFDKTLGNVETWLMLMSNNIAELEKWYKSKDRSEACDRTYLKYKQVFDKFIAIKYPFAAEYSDADNSDVDEADTTENTENTDTTDTSVYRKIQKQQKQQKQKRPTRPHTIIENDGDEGSIIEEIEYSDDESHPLFTEGAVRLPTSLEKQIAEKFLRQEHEHLTDQDRLIDDMNNRRENLKFQKPAVPARKVKFNVDVVGETDDDEEVIEVVEYEEDLPEKECDEKDKEARPARPDNLDYCTDQIVSLPDSQPADQTANQTADKDNTNTTKDNATTPEEQLPSLEELVQQLELENAALDKRIAEHTLEHTREHSEQPPIKSGVEAVEGEMVNVRTATEVANAPYISPLTTMTENQRLEKLERMFIKATENVKAILGNKKYTQEEFEAYRESMMNNLYKNFMNTGK